MACPLWLVSSLYWETEHPNRLWVSAAMTLGSPLSEQILPPPCTGAGLSELGLTCLIPARGCYTRLLPYTKIHLIIFYTGLSLLSWHDVPWSSCSPQTGHFRFLVMKEWEEWKKRVIYLSNGLIRPKGAYTCFSMPHLVAHPQVLQVETGWYLWDIANMSCRCCSCQARPASAVRWGHQHGDNSCWWYYRRLTRQRAAVVCPCMVTASKQKGCSCLTASWSSGCFTDLFI